MAPAIYGKGVQCQVISAVVASLGAVIIGTIIGYRWTPNVKFTSDSDDNYDYIDNISISAVSLTIFCFSAMVSALLSGIWTKLYGHKCTLWFGDSVIIVGWVLGIVMPNMPYILPISDAMLGLGAGAISLTIPAYVGEISQPHIRGRLGVMFHAFLLIGVMYIYALLSIENISITVVKVLCIFLSLTQMMAVIFIPESPYSYLKRGKQANANTSMTQLRDDDNVAQELSVIQADIDQQIYQQDTVWKVLTNKANRTAQLIALFTLVIPSLVDIRFIIADMMYICERCDFPNISIFIIFFSQLLITFVTMKMIDKIGRRVLLMTSGALMVLCCIGFFCVFKINMSNYPTWLLIVLIYTYVLAFSLGFGSVPWVIMGEIFPTNIKILGPSLITAIYWFVALIQSMIYQYIRAEKSTSLYVSDFIGRFMMWLLGTLFVYFFVPETKNKSLTEIKTIIAGDGASLSTNVV